MITLWMAIGNAVISSWKSLTLLSPVILVGSCVQSSPQREISYRPLLFTLKHFFRPT